METETQIEKALSLGLLSLYLPIELANSLDMLQALLVISSSGLVLFSRSFTHAGKGVERMVRLTFELFI